MGELELDEILVHHWPAVTRRAMADSSDKWVAGFCKSIARHGKRPTWRPSDRQAFLMRKLVAELGHAAPANSELIER